MSSIEAGRLYNDNTDDDIDEFLVIDVARGTVELMEPVDTSDSLTGIHTINGRTYRHRCDDTESLEWKLETGDISEGQTVDRTPFVEAVDG